MKLRERNQRAAENLSELAQDIRRLTNLAYPKFTDVRETLAKEQFLDSLHSEKLRIRTKKARPSSLNDVRHAVEMEAYYKAEQKHLASSQVLATSTAEGDSQIKHQSDLKSLKSKIQQLQRQSNSAPRLFQSRNMGSDRPRNNFRTPRRNPRHTDVPMYNKSQRSNTNTAHKMDQSTCDKCGEVKKSTFNGAGLFFVTAHLDGCAVSCLIAAEATLSLMSTQAGV
ncbi:hypothetical protein DPMN_091342 [Dreissena polymorpha]|uniref:Uncharacterized protein n=1 Tax=Dreissena polymorpha TaxID=45954 RepID=A0A9D4QZX6_DREPO|nr:hypothetical protein DPMN_091342 [Dreissena polymorpha]